MKISNLNIGPYTKRHRKGDFQNKFSLHQETYNLFDHFDRLHSLKNKSILDFGGGFGNLIISSKGNIDPFNYTCIDVDATNLAKGKKMFEQSVWIHSDEYNPMYNPNGDQDLKINGKFDVIIAYSVFTHDSFESLIKNCKKFKSVLNTKGKIFVTVLLSDQPYIDFLLDKRSQDYGECDQIDKTQDINYVVNNRCTTQLPKRFECDFLLTIYKKSFIQQFGKLHQTNLFQDCVLEVDTNSV